MIREKEIEEYILELLSSKKDQQELQIIRDDPGIDLVGSGLVSSLDFITLVSDLEKKFNIEIDFESYDPALFTTINGLVNISVKAKRMEE